MRHELRQATRSIARAPGHAATIVLTLALAIGATTAIFSVVQGVLLEPLPFPGAERLVMLWQRAPGVGVDEDWLSTTQYFDLRERVESFEELALVFGTNVTLTEDRNEPERLGALSVSSSFFSMLGIEPIHGRVLSAGDDVPGTAPRALLGSALFERRFKGDPGVIGRTLRIDDRRVEVVGVLAPLPFDMDLLPTLVTVPSFDLVMSLPVENPGRTTHGSENYNVLAKTAPGVTAAQLETELLSVAARFVEDPESLGAGLEAGKDYWLGTVPLLEQATGEIRLPLVVLLVATAVLLGIACANVANLLLTRAERESRQSAIRVALGASRERIVSRSLIESVVLSLAGGAFGVGLAAASLAALRATAPREIPRISEVAIDYRVVLFATALSLLASLVFGLWPALRTAHIDPQEALSEGVAAARARSLWRGGSSYLVIVQVALSLVLVIMAGLLARSLWQLRDVDPGFRPEGLLTFRLSLVGDRFNERDDRVRFFETLFERLRGLPEVTEAGGTSILPLTRGYAWTDFVVEGQEIVDDRERIVSDVYVATPGYFEALGVQLLAGRHFDETDDDEPQTVLVNRSFAERFWGLDEAVGKWIGQSAEDRATIVGVVDDMLHYGLGEDARLAVFYSHRASGRRTLYGVARTSADPSRLAGTLRSVVTELDRDIPAYDVKPMAGRVSESLARERVLVLLLQLFSTVALLISAVGLYGVLSFTVVSHRREIAVRQALGATPKDVSRQVLGGAAVVTLCGLAIGLVVAVAGARLVASLTYGVSSTDPLSFASGSVLVAVIALGASLLPARRAARVDPISALKQD